MSGTSLTILVVDHDDDRAQELVARLRADGHDVSLAVDEIGARVAARDQNLDAAIVCLRPEAGSIDLARSLRTNLLSAGSVLVAIDPGDVRAEASDTQAFDVVLQQPIDLSQLSGLLHHLCFQRRTPLSPNQH